MLALEGPKIGCRVDRDGIGGEGGRLIYVVDLATLPTESTLAGPPPRENGGVETMRTNHINRHVRILRSHQALTQYRSTGLPFLRQV
jgi:hypothetical protein